MKVYVTQGHEKGIGLEVFFKSCLLLTQSEVSHIRLLAFKETVTQTLKTLKIPFDITAEGVTLARRNIKTEWLENVNVSQSFTALELGMKLSEASGVLYTLPTSKDQFPGFPGHTEYFRSFYNRQDLGMYFSGPNLQVLLLSDHTPINDLSTQLTEDLIFRRLNLAIRTLEQWDWPINRVLVSGLNPHAGESGIIGNEDDRVSCAIKLLKQHVKIELAGPFPGDTMLFEKTSSRDLLVYLFHDQGLGVFKGLQGFIGSNITLGLPYPRFSPDHGTSFSLFGKNQADYRGCEFSLKEALVMLRKVSYGKNSGY